MAASKTRLTKYLGHDGAAVYAAKITEIIPFTAAGAPPDSATLKFGELDKQAHLVGSWIAEQQPKVGGYFVAYDMPDGQTLCRYETADALAQRYTRAVAA